MTEETNPGQNADDAVIKRLLDSPERRIFKIDVGNLPKGKAEDYIIALMKKYRQRKLFDPKTGNPVDDINMTEDYYFSV